MRLDPRYTDLLERIEVIGVRHSGNQRIDLPAAGVIAFDDDADVRHDIGFDLRDADLFVGDLELFQSEDTTSDGQYLGGRCNRLQKY